MRCPVAAARATRRQRRAERPGARGPEQDEEGLPPTLRGLEGSYEGERPSWGCGLVESGDSAILQNQLESLGNP